MIEKLDRLVDEITCLNSKLILLVGPPQSGKSKLIFQLSERRSASVLNVGSALGRQLLSVSEGVPWERWILRNFSKMRVHARLSFIVTTNLPSFVTLIRCFIGRSKPLGRLEEFGQAVFHKEVKIQRSLGTPSFV